MGSWHRHEVSKHWASGPMLSISRNVRLSVCLSVCPSVRLSVCSLLRYSLNFFLPPLLKVGCPIFLEIRNSWRKVMERSSLIFAHFCLKVVWNRRAKKKMLILPYKTWWKPRFLMDKRLLVKGRIANFGISLDVFLSFAFWMIFSVFQKNQVFCVFLETTLPDGLKTSGWRAYC